MKDGLRFVDCDMHIIEPADLYTTWLDPRFRDRVTTPIGPDGKPRRGNRIVDGLPTSADLDLEQYRKPVHAPSAPAPDASVARQNLAGSARFVVGNGRLTGSGRLDFAIERDFSAEAQVMAMAMEGVDVAVLFPSEGLSLMARNDLDPQLSLAVCQAYNNWLHDFCSFSPHQLKMAAMLPVHDVNLACQELFRCVHDLGAVGSFIRPNLVNGRFWHSNYWNPLYQLHEELDVTWGFHEGTAAYYSIFTPVFGENHYYRHVTSHWMNMQLALIAQMIGGVFEFYPRLRVGYLEAQNSWVPGLLTRIEWDYEKHAEGHAPYLRLTPREYFRRNCWAAVEGSEPEMESTAGLIGADRMCVSTDYPHSDSDFPEVSNNVLRLTSRAVAAGILGGGGTLWNLSADDFRRADAAMEQFLKSHPGLAPAAAPAAG